jgi:hypothetical protein
MRFAVKTLVPTRSQTTSIEPPPLCPPLTEGVAVVVVVVLVVGAVAVTVTD